MKHASIFISSIIATLILISGSAVHARGKSGRIMVSRPVIHVADGRLQVSLSLCLDSLNLGSNHQLYISPVVEDTAGNSVVMPAVLVNGRNMHLAYQRGYIHSNESRKYDVVKEVRRTNGKAQLIKYDASAPYSRWMLANNASVRIVTDSCGCGHLYGKNIGEATPLALMPHLYTAYITPEVTELPVTVHEGRARVQFEVNSTELHAEPYTCRTGQKIDNREQLKIINDSVEYALSDPNVEIASINICGYASPESPYMHNEQLSTGRSRALAEYLGDLYQLPTGKSTYSSVPENWKEFRDIVASSNKISEEQRKDLLELIDAPAYGASDYDAKENTLKTDKRFASLYRRLILPEWFPLLRCTQFTINTRLKPLADDKLAEVIHANPEMMSLNQMMRVARLYPEGSREFNDVINIALRYYPKDEAANLNAAVAEISRGEYVLASRLLENAGNSPEAENARGVISAQQGEIKKALEHFKAAGSLPEAIRNFNLLHNLDSL